MNYNKSAKQFFELFLLVIWLWAILLPTPLALADPEDLGIPPEAIESAAQDRDWTVVHQKIATSFRGAYDSTEAATIEELDKWADSLIKKVDHPFLDWYFNFWNQKGTEYVAPVAWAAHKLDSNLQLLRAEDEKDLNANQVLQKRMAEKFSQKFAEMVMTEEAQIDLEEIAIHALEKYMSEIDLTLDRVQNSYQIPQDEWGKHLEDISFVLLQNGPNSYEIDQLASDLSTKALAVMGVSTTSKLVSALVVKSASKMAAKGGAVLAAKWGASVIDPTLGIGLVAWDVWTYNDQVAKNRPLLKKTLSQYITESKNAMLENAEGNGIMDAIASVQNDLLHDI